MHVRKIVSLCLLLVGLVSSAFAERVPIRQHRHKQPANGPVRHDTTFKAVPNSKLKIRAVQYDGSTNGTLTVQVKNTEKTAMKFAATGLYFVPEGDPDTAPQRLGAVGPMQLATDDAKQRKELTEIEVAAGATVELELDVFCIDSHRPSPSPSNRFNIGASKLPKELAHQIETRAEAMVKEEAITTNAPPAAARPMAKQKIQSEVWKSRDAKWIKLDGEGKQEAAK